MRRIKNQIKNDLILIIDTISKTKKFNLDIDINNMLSFLSIKKFNFSNYIIFKNPDEEKIKKEVKEILKNIINFKDDDLVFSLFIIINSMGTFSWDDFDETFQELFSNKDINTSSLLKKIIDYLNFIPNKYLDFESFESFEKVKELKRNISFVSSIKNETSILSYFISYSKEVDFNYILSTLKMEQFIQLIQNFNFDKFYKKLSKLKFNLKEEEKYKLILIVGSDYNFEEIPNEAKKILKKIFEDDPNLIGKEVFNQIYENEYKIEKKEVFNQIFTELFSNTDYRKKFLKCLNWGEDFLNFSLYLLTNEIGQEIKDDHIFYAEAFLKKYKNTKNKISSNFYLTYISLNDNRSYLTLYLLIHGLIKKDKEYLKFLKQELTDMKYQYYSTEFETIFNLNRKVEELLTLYIILYQKENTDYTLIKLMKKSLEIITNIVLDNFLQNYKIYFREEDNFIRSLKKIDELPNDNEFKKIMDPILIKFKSINIF